MPVDVFISYRGADRVLARKLAQRLRSRWGSRVYRDETSLVAGRSWADELKAVMSDAKVTLALIGPGWHVREKGEDWVRDELLGAIEAGNPVLPVLAGDSDTLAKKLSELPEAFEKQAVKVSDELAGFDLHEIEKALRRLGAFGERKGGGLGRELLDTIPDRCVDVIDAVVEGRSAAFLGASGSGRRALMNRISVAVKQRGDLVSAYGIDPYSRSRRTHSVIASWIDGLCKVIEERPAEERSRLGRALVHSILEFGPDLLTRKVLRPAVLLPLGDDYSDQKILDAAQRPTDRWAPFPPERLVSQSMSVIRNFAEAVDVPLVLIIDTLETIDGSSKDLVRRLLHSTPDGVRLVLATSSSGKSDGACSVSEITARALAIPSSEKRISWDDFETLSLHDASVWGEPGAIVERWLKNHDVQLAEGVSKAFEGLNPYYTLSALWYLVDNGQLVEAASSEIEPPLSSGENTESDARRQSQDNEIVTWQASHQDKGISVPAREQLLDHMIEEFIPVRFRKIIEAGSLTGRRFLFSAAFAAVNPPESIDGQQPGPEAIENWCIEADQCWEELAKIDPDGSVIVCHYSVDNERVINLTQFDLVTHFAAKLSNDEKLTYHKQLALYFTQPIASDSSTSLDDKYRNAQAAAAHWASALEPRNAADAERVAAGLAERALAYPEARKHYGRAIRLFTQLLAERKHDKTVSIVEHEDMLILANCLYQVGQMTRLAQERRSYKSDSADPTRYFEGALKRLKSLSKNLNDKSLVAPTSDQHRSISRRNLPEPNLLRHHIRLCETLSGWIKLELSEWYRDGDLEKSRSLLFDALRHAESARGESDSRWLLAAASAKLAQILVDESRWALQAGCEQRSHNLAIEAQFHIERVIGLAAVSPGEDRNLVEPRASAWMVLGQLFQVIQLQPQLAEWAFHKMNDHGSDVSDLVDMHTDHRLGRFLLSKHSRRETSQTEKARKLLQRYKSWAIESGISSEYSSAHISLALLEIVEQLHHRSKDSAKPAPELQAAREHIGNAVRWASTARDRKNAYLLKGFMAAIDHPANGGIDYRHPELLEAFRLAYTWGAYRNSADEDILKKGWRSLLIKLLRWCPAIAIRIGVEEYLETPVPADGPGRSRHQFFNALVDADKGKLRKALNRAKTYLKIPLQDTLKPSSDKLIWQLLKSRVPRECFNHALRTRNTARELLDQHYEHLEGGADMLFLHRRNIDYAIAVHEWYRSTDTSRLLTLARESNMSIDGHEWASPKLLSGRLAMDVLDRQYGAVQEIGEQRFRQIKSMVVNWARGVKEAGVLEQIFYIALHRQEPASSQVKPGLQVHGYQPLTRAYQQALDERERLVHQAGLPLVQDQHLQDAGVDSEEPVTFDDVQSEKQAEDPVGV